ncbi:MAG: bifunctional [glutamate--ammonia ligase]-adenylyl-L-tyrosine phosphorylase/[glutamate--ammonia-ligase] adenylyltransferase [Gammaproteobacteria bacterium]|nr:bifunctional [glutamate--ammonia ligase]-adenylyl-L-tyrosine phosphorylase/[glutamate--ammonia-ligase] adenylyltransferase [Gammaproteobacteria bacterium]
MQNNLIEATPDTIPAVLLETSREHLQQFKSAATEAGCAWPATDDVEQKLLVFFSCSLFAVRFCCRFPDILLGDEAEKHLADSIDLGDYKAAVAAVLDAATDDNQLMSGLRRLRQREMIRIAWRDLFGLADTAETLRNLSEFAEACIDLTLQRCYDDLAERFGVPRNAAGEEQKLVVLGMGKLGGLELNYSSDIDLIFAFPESAETDGRKQVDAGDFYRRVTQKFVRLLSESTADGFVFRVDLRLRPFGASGPVAMTFDAMEAYYQTQGREWERYALIKARVVSGDRHSSEQLFQFLRPFVFRRYLDYSAFESLRDLKAKISAEVRRKGMDNNVKLGAGGIREIEFIGQAFQLVRGGKETELQERGIMKVLPKLAQRNYLSAEEVERLLAAYDFLRRAENRLQMVQDQQTHNLPEQALEQCRLAFAMGFADWPAFTERLTVHRQHVEEIFEAVFKLDDESQEAPVTRDVFDQIWAGDLADEEAVDALAEQGFSDVQELYRQLTQLGQGGYYLRLTNIARERLDRIIPLTLRATVEAKHPDETARRMLVLLRNIAGRSVYVQVLLDSPQSLALLVRMFDASKWMAEFVSAYPMVIDEILDHRILQQVPDEADLRAEMEIILQRVRDQALDVQMDAVRQFKQANVMRVAAADLENLIPLKEVSNRLTMIAEVVLQASCDLVWTEMVRKHGRPGCVIDGKPVNPGFAIVAYGKLGGIELGYGSDLDIVFLHGSEGEKQQTDGDKVIDNMVFFARVAQKMISFLTTTTPAGTLYEIDTRLRPNGQSGLLVSSLQAFESYQKNEAWTWEHQALVRARVVVADEHIRAAFDRIRCEVLGQRRDRVKLLNDVTEMRERMHRELSKAREGQFDLKQDRGGIVDIEFMVQYSVLAHAWRQQELLAWTDNLRILETLARGGFLSPESADRVIEVYFTYRKFTHEQALQGTKHPVALDATIEACRDEVRDVWTRLMV